MKKTIKILTILLIALMLVAIALPVQVDAATDVGGVSIEPKKEAGKKVEGLGNKILGVIQVVGTIIAVGVLMVIGIKYMMGSAEEKAEYKKTMLPYVIGAIILFAAVNIAKVLVDMSNELGKTVESGAVITTEVDRELV